MNKELKLLGNISLAILFLGTLITISLTNIVQSKLTNDEVFEQVTFLYK